MKNKIEQKLERSDKMRFKFEVCVTGFEKPFAETIAASLSEAQRNILHRKDEFRKNGIILFSMEDVKKLFFKIEKDDPIAAKPPKKQQRFYWHEDGEFTAADRAALLKH